MFMRAEEDFGRLEKAGWVIFMVIAQVLSKTSPQEDAVLDICVSESYTLSPAC